MKSIQSILFGLLLIGGSIPQSVLSNSILVESSSGEKFEVGIDANDRFLDVLDQIQAYFQEDMLVNENHREAIEAGASHPLQWNLTISHAGITARSKQIKRSYQAAVSASEKEAIAYIVNTLADAPLLTLNSQKSKLEKLGDQIVHIHPFRFLITIFTDDELRVKIAAIRERTGLVKNKFFAGITKTLKEEAANNNLHEHVKDFAKTVNIDVKLITPSLEEKKWEKFVNVLIDEIPRGGNPNRYNM